MKIVIFIFSHLCFLLFSSSKSYATSAYYSVTACGRCISWAGYMSDIQARWKFKSIFSTIVILYYKVYNFQYNTIVLYNANSSAVMNELNEIDNYFSTLNENKFSNLIL